MKLIVSNKSNRQVNMAAQRMVEWLHNDEELEQEDFDTVAAFRAAHAYPLRVVTSLLRQRAQAVDSSATVYARAKRMISIILKLQRTPTMQVTTMQDIGGCRAVVDSIGSVARLTEQFRRMKPDLDDPKEFDYITQPKPDGYRSIHFVVKYRPKSKAYSYLPSRRIELQIRSALQHKWATALETIDLFTAQTLKAGGGQYSWKRFFVLTSTLFAMKEDCPIVPGSVASDDALLQEIRGLWRGIRIREQFDGWITAAQTLIPQEHGTNATYLVEVDVDQKATTVKGFSDVGDAYQAYADAEQKNRQIRNRTAVLVSMQSVNQLRGAFPSYYGDTKAFLDEVEGLIK
jgi:ppGpp synthetase/RelA/SpoT-type nucleotidyltranferase